MFNFGGGMLTGSEIEKQVKKGNIKIEPYDPSYINPNSYNLRLHPQLKVYKRGSRTIEEMVENTGIDPRSIRYVPGYTSFINGVQHTTEDTAISDNLVRSDNKCPIDMMKDNEVIEFSIPEEGYILRPGILYIGRTVERTCSEKFIPMLDGRSSGGRLGISIHICAGFGDIGFDGTWTLEITVVEPVIVYPYKEIAQVSYFKPYGSIKKLYRGRYYGQEDATSSRFFKGRI